MRDQALADCRISTCSLFSVEPVSRLVCKNLLLEHVKVNMTYWWFVGSKGM